MSAGTPFGATRPPANSRRPAHDQDTEGSGVYPMQAPPLSFYLCRALPPDIDHEIAEGVARPIHAPRADDEQPVRPDVPVEPAYVCVVQPDPIRQFRSPVLAVHRQQPRRLHRAVLRGRAGILRHTVQRGGDTLALHSCHELEHPPPIVLRFRHQLHDLPLVRLALYQRVPVEHGPHDRQAVSRRVLITGESARESGHANQSNVLSSMYYPASPESHHVS